MLGGISYLRIVVSYGGTGGSILIVPIGIPVNLAVFKTREITLICVIMVHYDALQGPDRWIFRVYLPENPRLETLR